MNRLITTKHLQVIGPKKKKKKRVHVYISFSRFDLDILFLFCVPEMMRCLNLGLEFEICWVLII